MIKKQSNFIEAHIEKAVLIISGLIAAYIFYAFVLRGPNEIPYDNQKFRPGQLDIYIAEQSEKLKDRLGREPVLKPAYVPQSISFLAKMNSVIDKNLNIIWPVPSAAETSVDKKYRMPVIGQVNDVDIEHIRAAAYIPKVPVTLENALMEDTYEPNDLDLVSVSANFDMSKIADSFQECFAGKEVPQGWRDSSLAKPVFAGVQLQRQRLGNDDQWGPWEDVDRLKIDPKKDEKMIEDVNELPMGGVMVQLAKFADQKTQINLLQPDSYKIASAEEDWLPPALHRKFLAFRREQEAQDRRDTLATERETRTAEERDRTSLRTGREDRPAREDRTIGDRGRGTTGRNGSRTAGGGGAAGRGGSTAGRGGAATPARGPGMDSRNSSRTTTVRTDRNDRRTETSTAEQKKIVKSTVTEASINEELKKIVLTKKDISTLRESVTFWAHDDTVEAGDIYRYRIRFGIFNPVAGTGQIMDEDASAGSKVVLWSDFSEPTDEIEIPRKLYFFPVNVQEAAKAVEVQVCKYALGYWYGEQFMVKRGDMIGKPAKIEASDKDKESGAKIPETLDYTTGAIIVDMMTMNDWFGEKTIQPRQYFDILFSYDGFVIDRLPAKQMYWPEEVRLKYAELKGFEKKAKEPFRAWSSTGFQGLQKNVPLNPMDRRGGPMDRNEQMDEYMRMRMGDRAPAR